MGGTSESGARTPDGGASPTGGGGRGGGSRFDLTSDPGALDWRAVTLSLQAAAEGLDGGVHALLALGLAHPELRFDPRLDEALTAARAARELAARLRASAVVQGEVWGEAQRPARDGAR